MRTSFVFEVLRVKRLADIQDSLQSILEVSDAGVKVEWVKEKKLCIVMCIKVTV